LQAPYGNHGGLTPAALVSARDECTRTCGVSVLQVRFPSHGGLPFAALFRRAFVHRENRFLTGRHPHRNTRAGGVSPPGELLTPMQRRSAYTPSAVCRTSALVSAQACFHSHGGLTPAALFGVRLCIAKVVFSPADVRTPTRERGALAPRGMFSECEPDYGNPAHCRCRRGLQPHGGLTPAAPGRGFANRWTMFDSGGTTLGSLNHGGLTPAALFRRAFVHRKNRFLAGGRPHRNTRAGGVSPPWVRCRHCVAVREHTAGSLLRVCGGAFASALR
jgi:hypothetical protein